jgi:hypothetical protein
MIFRNNEEYVINVLKKFANFYESFGKKAFVCLS